MAKRGVLLVNLGTPTAPEPTAVGSYLNEFLSDPEVIDLPWLLRQVLVKGVIVPFRRKKSAKLYQKIWTSRGSPLLFHTQDLTSALRSSCAELDFEFSFRYGRPSLEQGLSNLRDRGVRDLLILPLYPQYATSTTRTIFTELERLQARKMFDFVRIKASFHLQDFYLNSVVALIKKQATRGKHLLLTYHGIPLSHLTKNHPACAGCLAKPVCEGQGDENCYRRHCFETSRAIAKKLGLQDSEWSLSFQSRLGRNKWLEPSTTEILQKCVERGHRDLVLVAPGFVADCLETLEELDVEARSVFQSVGGQSLTRVSCLNSDPQWVSELGSWLKKEWEN